MNTRTLGALFYFHHVVKEGGFSRASRVLKVQQPAVSKGVRRLEEELGGALLRRGRSGVTLTSRGRGVYRRCEAIFSEVGKLSVPVTRELRFGASDQVAVHLLPDVLAAWLGKHPNVIPRIFVAPSERLCEDILGGDKEFALVMTVPQDKRLEWKTIARVPSSVVIATSFLRDSRVRESFIGSRELDDTKNRSFPTVTRLKKTTPATRITVSCNSIQAHKSMVLAGVGVAILPDFMIDDELACGTLSRLDPDFRFFARLKLVKRKNALLSSEARALVKAFRERWNR